MPTAITKDLIGFPVDRLPEFLEWEDMMFRGDPETTGTRAFTALALALANIYLSRERLMGRFDGLIQHSLNCLPLVWDIKK